MTMVEIGIILVILAILAVAFLPTMGNIIAVVKTKGASEEVAMAIRQTRQLAITRAVNHCIEFDDEEYEIFEGSCGGTSVEGPVMLSQGATVSGTDEFIFTPLGTTTAGTVTITITDPSACAVTLTVTVAGAVQLASPPC